MEAAGYPVVSAHAQDVESLLRPKKNGSKAPQPARKRYSQTTA